MIELGICTIAVLKNGVVRFGIDALGGDEGGDLLRPSIHPFGFRSRPRAPEKTSGGDLGRGAPLVSCDFGGGDVWAWPGQDPRVTLPDEGDGGAVLYAWTGSAVSYVLLSGADGKVRVSAPELVNGDDAVAKTLVKEELLLQWISSVLIPALANSPGGPITVSPPSGIGTTKLRSE